MYSMTTRYSSHATIREKSFLFRVRLLLVLSLLCLSPFIATAQQDAGFLTGTVTDPTGGTVAGAKVHIVNSSTGIAQDVLTNESGFYRSQPLQPGTYSAIVQVNGY